jgi:rhodanese-related sulfurtransferase
MGYSCLSMLAGGIDSWVALGQQLFQGVYVPSKALGEWVEHAFGTPSIDAHTLSALQMHGEDVVVLDPRTADEHAVRHVPRAISCPGAELVYRFGDLVPSRDTLVVVACGGRTRGIMGAQSLITAGVPNRVAALRDGVHGWSLAGYGLEAGQAAAAGSSRPAPVSEAAHAQAVARADDIVRKFGLSTIDMQTLARWREEPQASRRTTYVFDVRNRAEYDAGHLPGSRHAPGGQLVQATDQWIGTQGARVVLVDNDGVRSVLTALWLSRAGWEVHALRNGLAGQSLQVSPAVAAAGELIDADQAARVQRDQVAAPAVVPEIEPAEAAQWLREGALAVSFDPSADHLAGSAPGAVWASRARIDELVDLLEQHTSVVLFSADAMAARLAAVDLLEQPVMAGRRLRVVRGGLQSWRAAGLPLQEPPADSLPPARRLDTLYWAQDRRRGDAQAMKQYLDWEKNLLNQLTADGFAFGAPAR